MSTQDTSNRDDAMTAGGPGADSQHPPAAGARQYGTANDTGDASGQSASDTQNTPAQEPQTAQGPQTPGAGSTEPAGTGTSSSPGGGQSTTNSPSGPSSSHDDTSPTTGADAGSSSGDSANGDGATNTASGDGSTNTAGGDDSTTTGSGDGSADTGNDNSALQLAGADAPLQPIFDTANSAIDGITGSSGLLQGIIGLADTAGVGAIGATPSADGHSNLITDVVNLPGGILDGNLNAGVTHVAADLSDTLGAANGLVSDGLGGDAGHLLGNGPLGSDGPLHPMTGLIDSASHDLQSVPLVNVNGGGVLDGNFGDLGGSSSGDAVHLTAGPQDDSGFGLGVLSSPDTGHTASLSALDGGSEGLQIADLNVLSGAGPLNAPVLDGPSMSPLIGTGSSEGLLTINGGNNAGDGGVIGSTIGDLNGSSSGHLVDADAGPHTSQGTDLGLLTGQPDSGHTVTASAVDVGPGGPQLADLGVLMDTDVLNIPNLNGAGTDSLAGGLPGGDTGSTGTAQPTPIATNLGEIHDLLSVPTAGDHGILDVNHTHII